MFKQPEAIREKQNKNSVKELSVRLFPLLGFFLTWMLGHSCLGQFIQTVTGATQATTQESTTGQALFPVPLSESRPDCLNKMCQLAQPLVSVKSNLCSLTRAQVQDVSVV